MAVANSTTLVSTTRVSLTTVANGWVQNKGGAPVFLGGSTVTADSNATGGLVLFPGEKIQTLSVGPLYAITASSYDAEVQPTAEIAILSGQ
jgi:hypothetical protein